MKTTPQERDEIRNQLGAQFVYGRQVQVEVDPKWLYDLTLDVLELELKIQSMEAAAAAFKNIMDALVEKMSRR
jgi:hypothetical protein